MLLLTSSSGESKSAKEVWLQNVKCPPRPVHATTPAWGGTVVASQLTHQPNSHRIFLKPYPPPPTFSFVVYSDAFFRFANGHEPLRFFDDIFNLVWAYISNIQTETTHNSSSTSKQKHLITVLTGQSCAQVLKAGVHPEFCKISRVPCHWNLNLDLLRVYSLFSQNGWFLPLRKEILIRSCPIELVFSGFVVLSTVCVLSIYFFHSVHFWRRVALKHVLDFPLFQIWLVTISCVLNFSKISMLKTASYLSSSKTWKKYSFWSVLEGVFFSQVRPNIPQRVAELICWCQVTIQF